MLGWASEGLEYHQQNKLDTCLFCGNELTKNRVRDLKSALNSKFDEIILEIADQVEAAGLVGENLKDLQLNIPSKGDFVGANSEAFGSIRKIAESSCSAGSKLATQISSPLQKKERRLNRHNTEQDAFSQNQASAKAKLRDHFLAKGHDRYGELANVSESEKTVHQKMIEQTDSLEAQITELRQNLRKHGPAAKRINEIIAAYLGHNSLQIEPINEGEDGYSIFRNGKFITGPLSEGEKTAIAICYFLSTTEAEGRRLKDLIVVVDDPISSLDTRALNYAFNLIRGALAGAAQLIVLTHNIHFMSETKKWLKTKAEKGEAALLFLDATVDVQKGTRHTNIIELPKLIREYESEYHYVFRLILGFRDTPSDYENYFYLMPNALRKVLDIFFCF